MTTRRPLRPIVEKGVCGVPYQPSWQDRLNDNIFLVCKIGFTIVIGPFYYGWEAARKYLGR